MDTEWLYTNGAYQVNTGCDSPEEGRAIAVITSRDNPLFKLYNSEKTPVVFGGRAAPGRGGVQSFLSPPQCVGGGGEIFFPAKLRLVVTPFAAGGGEKHSRLPDDWCSFPGFGGDRNLLGYLGLGHVSGGRDGTIGAYGIFGAAP